MITLHNVPKTSYKSKHRKSITNGFVKIKYIKMRWYFDQIFVGTFNKMELQGFVTKSSIFYSDVIQVACTIYMCPLCCIVIVNVQQNQTSHTPVQFAHPSPHTHAHKQLIIICTKRFTTCASYRMICNHTRK